MANGYLVENMVEAQISLLMVIFIMASTRMVDQMARVLINGQMAASMRAALWTVSSMAKVLGGRTKTILLAINTQESTVWTKSMDTENSLGNQEMSTKGITIKMNERDMEKCTLLMVPYTRVNGTEAYKQGDRR